MWTPKKGLILFFGDQNRILSLEDVRSFGGPKETQKSYKSFKNQQFQEFRQLLNTFWLWK